MPPASMTLVIDYIVVFEANSDGALVVVLVDAVLAFAGGGEFDDRVHCFDFRRGCGVRLEVAVKKAWIVRRRMRMAFQGG